jgi:hypothetical protein
MTLQRLAVTVKLTHTHPAAEPTSCAAVNEGFVRYQRRWVPSASSAMAGDQQPDTVGSR